MLGESRAVQRLPLIDSLAFPFSACSKLSGCMPQSPRQQFTRAGCRVRGRRIPLSVLLTCKHASTHVCPYQFRPSYPLCLSSYLSTILGSSRPPPSTFNLLCVCVNRECKTITGRAIRLLLLAILCVERVCGRSFGDASVQDQPSSSLSRAREHRKAGPVCVR